MVYIPNLRKQYSPERKAKSALLAIRGEEKINQIASINKIHPNQIKQWKKIIEENYSLLFSDKRKSESRSQEELIDNLYKVIGQRDIELEWLKKNLSFRLTNERSKRQPRNIPTLTKAASTQPTS